MKISHLLFLLGATLISYTPCHADTQLIQDGDFETLSSGTNFGSNWTIQNQNKENGTGSFYIETPGADSQLGAPTPSNNSDGGARYAVTDSPGYFAGAHALLQTFVVPESFLTITLNFQMFINSFDPISGTNGQLDYAIPGANYVRVDILTADASAFDIGTGVVRNVYIGGTENQNPYTSYTFDLTSYLSASGTYQLRFADVDQGQLNMGVDNVKITAVEPVPEPATVGLLGLGAVGLLWKGLKRLLAK